VFDAPPAHYKLRVTDENEENPAYVDIPLSFGAEIPPAELPARAPRRSDSTRSLAPCQCSQRQLRAEAVVSIDAPQAREGALKARLSRLLRGRTAREVVDPQVHGPAGAIPPATSAIGRESESGEFQQHSGIGFFQLGAGLRHLSICATIRASSGWSAAIIGSR